MARTLERPIYLSRDVFNYIVNKAQEDIPLNDREEVHSITLNMPLCKDPYNSNRRLGVLAELIPSDEDQPANTL